MTDDLASRGVEATDKLYADFVKLLGLLGHSNLLFDGGSNPKNPSTVPEACEKNNVEVSKLLATMKSTLGDMQLSYNYCNQLVKTHGKNLTLDLVTTPKSEMEVDKSPEYLQLQKQLLQKNADLKHLIEELQTIFNHINQLVSV